MKRHEEELRAGSFSFLAALCTLLMMLPAEFAAAPASRGLAQFEGTTAQDGWPVTRLFAAYEAGLFGLVEDELLRVADFRVLRKEIEAVRSVRRATVLAAFALEAAHAAYLAPPREGQWQKARIDEARGLLELGCSIARDLDGSETFQRAWSLASLALISIDTNHNLAERSFVNRHLGHLRAWGEPGRLALARAVDREQALGAFVYGYGIALDYNPDTEKAKTLRRVRQGFDLLRWAEGPMRSALDTAASSAEAIVRLGFLATVRQHLSGLRGGRESTERAVEWLSGIEADTDDAELRYLAHLFLGRAHELADAQEAAIGEYRAALRHIPGQAAGVALSGLLYVRGEAVEAERVLEEALMSTVHDPWRRYFTLGYRDWSVHVTAMREASQ